MTDMLGALAVALASALLALPLAAAAAAYRTPPDPITAMIDAAPTPTVVLSHDRRHIAAFDREGLPPVRALAQPILRLAGWRVNPRTQGPAEIRMNWLTGVTVQDVATGAAHAVSLPSGLRFTAPRWSPDDRHIAFVAEAPTGLELWVADAAGGPARRLSGPVLDAAFGVKLEWTPDSAAIVTLRKSPPAAPAPSQDVEGPTYAPQIRAPILLIHGEADDNDGAFPIQSDRFYAALKGNGATVRYVQLPCEPHGYRGRESTLDVQAEMIDWLDRYMKHAPPRAAASP